MVLFGYLNCSSVLQRKLPSHCFFPSICPICTTASEDLQRLFFYCCYSLACCKKLQAIFQLHWVFGTFFKENVLQVLIVPSLKPWSHYYGLMSTKQSLLNYGLKETKGCSTINPIINHWVKSIWNCKESGSMPLLGALFLSSLGISPSKIFVWIGRFFFFQLSLFYDLCLSMILILCLSSDLLWIFWFPVLGPLVPFH